MVQKPQPCGPMRVIIRFFPAHKESTLPTKDIEFDPEKAPIITRTVSNPDMLADAVIDGKAFIRESRDRYKFDTSKVLVNFELVGQNVDSGSVTSDSVSAWKFSGGKKS
jgi:hypothetical protein